MVLKGLSQNEAALFVLGGRRISGHGAEELFDGAFFNARLHVRLFKVKNSSKKSVFGKNRLPVRVFEGKKSSIESSIVTRLQENVFRARKNSPPSKSNFKSNISGQKTWTKCWNSGKIQLRVQHFGAEKLDNELNIIWEPTFLMTCSKTGDVFLRQRLFCS